MEIGVNKYYIMAEPETQVLIALNVIMDYILLQCSKSHIWAVYEYFCIFCTLREATRAKKSCSSVGGGDHICNFFKYLLIHLNTFILGNKMVNFNFLHSLTFINANANANNFLFFLLVFLWLAWRHKHGLCVLRVFFPNAPVRQAAAWVERGYNTSWQIWQCVG